MPGSVPIGRKKAVTNAPKAIILIGLFCWESNAMIKVLVRVIKRLFKFRKITN
jgi:hypothetical protein